jgi:dipeptide transport system ATP-binding protein
VMVMYLGKVVEKGACEEVFDNPRHPYTAALMSATPVADPLARKARIPLTGEIPSPLKPPPGCPFHPRCWKAQAICKQVEPLLEGPGHPAACHFPVQKAEIFAA